MWGMGKACFQTRFFVFFDPIHQGTLWVQQRNLPTHCLLHFSGMPLDYGEAGNIQEPIQKRCRNPAMPSTSWLVDDVRIHVHKSKWKSVRLEESPPPPSLPSSTFNPYPATQLMLPSLERSSECENDMLTSRQVKVSKSCGCWLQR